MSYMSPFYDLMIFFTFTCEEIKSVIFFYNHVYAGGHLGWDSEELLAAFTGKLCDNIREFITQCDKCQRMNPKFVKSSAQLHPIPVQPKVWNQVHDVRCIVIGREATLQVHTTGRRCTWLCGCSAVL